MINNISLDSLCAALSYAMGIEAPKQAAPACRELVELVDKKLSGKNVDRIIMYNPDAIAQWVFEKYNDMFRDILAITDIALPFATVMPSVTPVCFGTMYTGSQPKIHGILSYTKPVIKIDTIFDALIRNAKKPAIVCTENDSLSKIYLERDMDYFFYDSADKVNQKAEDLILRGEHDFIVIYNGNYDSTMHKFGPQSTKALAALQANIKAYHNFLKLAKETSKDKNTLIGFAMDHGCHEIDGNCGSHGLDMEEDLNIVHLYKLFRSEN
ncbi:MAG: hypothetical protein E7612_02045 [Ruminococcaceae bacterium]|nr:hypothetical protein [Oscillospiraceae bacterium]